MKNSNVIIYRNRKIHLLFSVFLWLSFSSCAQQRTFKLDASYNQRIIESLMHATSHTINAMLSENGEAKGNYRWLKGEWEAYETAWHTGQAIFGLLEAYKITGEQRALDASLKAGNWWVGLQFPKGHQLEGFLNAVHGDKMGELINTTTITDGTPGLFLLSKVTGDNTYANVATNAGAWILDNLYILDQRLSYNIVDGKTGEIWKTRSPHKQHEGLPFDIKHVARPNAEGYLWLDMYHHTGQERYKKAFLEICDKLVADQSPSGFWMDYEPNDPAKGRVHGRFNTWNAEALVEAYKLTDNKDYLESALKCADALAGVQDRTGVIWYASYLDGNHDKRSPCGSCTSFAGILWLELWHLGYDRFEQSIREALEFTLTNQFSENHPDKNLAGAYYGIRQRSKKNGEMQLYYRDINTAFGMRFLSEIHKSAFKE
ncbi:hypothetical protein [Winogradskyella sp.]|uniref:hypothetical protein n=1 Tax=Winogradskyella sp. TaxID=1883156 RepID=UPI00260220EE|nr:hypothetical protein [Winogradskyella sp.]